MMFLEGRGIAAVCVWKSFIGRLALGVGVGCEWFLLRVMPQTLLTRPLPSVGLPSAHSQDEIRQLYLQSEVFYHLTSFSLVNFFSNTDTNATTEFSWPSTQG